jgi:hypothetical protein
MERRYFVTIFAPDKSAFKGLANLNLDIFGSPVTRRGESSIGGLLSDDNIKQVKKAGFRVEVHDEYVEQARMSGLDAAAQSVQTMDDKQWLESFYSRKKVK